MGCNVTAAGVAYFAFTRLAGCFLLFLRLITAFTVALFALRLIRFSSFFLPFDLKSNVGKVVIHTTASLIDAMIESHVHQDSFVKRTDVNVILDDLFNLIFCSLQ